MMENEKAETEVSGKKTISASDKMRTMPIGKLIFVMSAPAMLSMTVQSLYNIVDSIFVARLGEEALAALSYAYPIQMLVMACAIGLGVGTASVISRRLGEGKKADASNAAQTGLLIAIIFSLFFTATGYFISRGFISLYSTDATTYAMSVDYLTIVTMVSFGVFIEVVISKSIQATGNMVIPMIAQLIGAGTNIILDPILIYGLIGFPAMGVQGAAIATVIGQCLAMLFALITLFVKKPEIDILFKKGFRPTKRSLYEIARVGGPSAVLNAIGAVLTTFMNWILSAFSQTAVAVYGIYFKIQSFVFMPSFGLNQGIMPILGYNYGAQNKERFMRTLKLSFLICMAIMTIGLILFQTMPSVILKMFDAQENMMSIGVRALRILSLGFIPGGTAVIMTAVFNSVGHGTKSMLLSLLRQLILILPISYLFGRLWGLDVLWFGFPVAEFMAMCIFIPILIKTVRTLFVARSDFPIPRPFKEDCKTCEFRDACK